MNCLSWMVGHVAAQEQEQFVYFPYGDVPHPGLNELVGFGRPASTPLLDEMWQVWHDITAAADTYLDTLTEEQLTTVLEQSTVALKDSLFIPVTEEMLAQETILSSESVGVKLLRSIYHYFYHTGEAHAVRQQLGHQDLPFFVGGIPDDLFLELE